MSERASTGKTIDQDGTEVLNPIQALTERSLAVDLAGAEIDRAVATAHKYPRSLDTVVKQISTLALYNEESAASCIYSLPRAGKPIIGASIGFANIVLQAWGNCRAASRIVYLDTKQKVVIAEGAFLDLQTNAQSIVPVNRRIVDKNGRLYSDDMQIVTGMAAASIARRNAILQGVPRGIWFPLWNDAFELVRGNVQTFVEKKDKALKAMSQFGVKPEQIFMALGLKGEADMTFEHIPSLRGMYQALRDGSVTVEEMFDPRRMTGKGFEQVENPLVGDEETGTEPGAEAPPATQQQQGTQQATNRDASHDPAEGQRDRPAAEPAREARQEPQERVSEAEPSQSSAQPQKAAQTATAAPATGAEQAGEPKGDKPTTSTEFMAYWQKFCLGTASAGARQQRWGDDRQLRKSCSPFSEEQFDEMNRLKDEGPGAKR